MKNSRIKRSIVYMTGLVLVLISLCAVLLLANAAVVEAKSDFKSGKGTAADPFEVSTVDEFSAVWTRLDAYYIQTENIDFTGKEFSVIGDLTHPFTGRYNGQQFMLSGINADFQDKDNVGVFAFIYHGAVVENVRVENSTFSGRQNVGAIAGMNAGRIEGAVSNAKVTAGVNAAGGITGTNSGFISRSVNAGVVTANGMYGGGIAGANTASISESYNRGSVTAATYAGGIAGVNNGKDTSAVIERTFNVGTVTGNVKGNVAGDNLKGTIQQGRFVEGSLLENVSAFNTGTVYATAARPAFEFKSKTAFSDWANFDANFMFIQNGTHPILKAEYVKVSEIRFTAGDTVQLRPGDEISVGAHTYPSHSSVQNVNLTVVTGADFCTLSNGVIRINDDAVVGSIITIKGEADGAVGTLQIEIVKRPVESIELKSENGKTTVLPGGSLQFNAEILPAAATVKDVKYTTSNPLADIDVFGNLTVSKDAPVGLEFIVSAASYDNISIRDELTVTVIAAEVKSVEITNTTKSFKVAGSLTLTGYAVTESFDTDDVSFTVAEGTTAQGANIVGDKLFAELPGDIYVIPQFAGVNGMPILFVALEEPVTSIVFHNGNSFPINGALSVVAEALPDNATFQNVTLSIVSDNNIGAVLTGNLLTASSTGTIVVRAEAGGIAVTQTIFAEPASESAVEVTDISLTVNSFIISRSLTLVATVEPSNAVANVYFEILDDGGTDAVITNGVLKNAKTPGIVTLRAYTASFEKTLTVEARKVAVDTVQFANANRFKITGSLLLNAVTTPANPTYPQAAYEIVSSTSSGAVITDGVLTASSVGEIVLRATVDGVPSAEFTVYADKEPVTEVKLASTSRSFKHTESLKLVAVVLPVQATNKEIEFLIDPSGTTEGIGADITNNVLTANSPGTVTVIMRCDGHDYPVSITVLKEPVIFIDELKTQVVSEVPDETVFRTSGLLDLTAVIYPANATYQGVKISIESTSNENMGAQLVDDTDKSNPAQCKKITSEQVGSVKVYLTAQLEGIVSIKVTSCDNSNIFKIFNIVVEKEFVSKIHFAMTNKAESTASESGNEIISYKYCVGDYNNEPYYYYDEVFVKADLANSDKFSLFFAVLSYATNPIVEPTHTEDFVLCYYTDFNDMLAGTNEYNLLDENPYFKFEKKSTISGILISKDVMKVIWVVAVSDHGKNGKVISAPVKITIYPTNIDDLKALGITSDGTIKTLKSITGDDGEISKNTTIPTMDGYIVSVKSSKFEFTKFIATQSVELQLKLYKYSIQSYDVSVYAVFDYGEEHEYRFSIPMTVIGTTNIFQGIQAIPKDQFADIGGLNGYSAVVIYDLYRSQYNFNANKIFDSGVRYMYVYGNPTVQHTGLNFTFDNSNNDIEITLHNIKFKANANRDAIRINGLGNLKLNIVGQVELYGGDGSRGVNGANGSAGYKSFAWNKNGSNGELVWNPVAPLPHGGNGEKGDDSGEGVDGENGTDGRNGGFAIRLGGSSTFFENYSNITVNIAPGSTLKLMGGKGGDGGKGGNGGRGQNGQSGGSGGWGGTVYRVVGADAGNGGNGGNGGSGGSGGDAGNGGNAGRGGMGINSSILSSATGVTSVYGADGSVGVAGTAGAGGSGGYGGSGGAGGEGFWMALLVPVFFEAASGTDGSNGSAGASGGSASNGTVKGYSNAVDENGCIA